MRATSAPPLAPVFAPTAVASAPIALVTPADRAAARNPSGDTTRERRAISPRDVTPGDVGIAAAGGLAAAGAGSGPAVLATLICLLGCFLVRALLPAAGLPRPLLRATRLERPG